VYGQPVAQITWGIFVRDRGRASLENILDEIHAYTGHKGHKANLIPQ